MTSYYKKNSFPLQYLSLPENTLLKSSLTTSLNLSSTLVTLFCREPPRHQVPYCLSSCDPVLISRKIILQISTRPLAYHWQWSATAQYLAQSPDHCVPQIRIPKGHPSTFPPSQINISTLCSKRPLLIITTDTLVIIMHPYPSQPTPPNWHNPFDIGDLIPRMGASTSLKPSYTSLSSCTSCSSTPCPTYFS